jgi:hypothetical protein
MCLGSSAGGGTCLPSTKSSLLSERVSAVPLKVWWSPAWMPSRGARKTLLCSSACGQMSTQVFGSQMTSEVNLTRARHTHCLLLLSSSSPHCSVPEAPSSVPTWDSLVSCFGRCLGSVQLEVSHLCWGSNPGAQGVFVRVSTGPFILRVWHFRPVQFILGSKI